MPTETAAPAEAPRHLRLKRLALVIASALTSINIWTGAPLLAVWVGSQVQAAQDRLSMTALLAVVVTLAVTLLRLTGELQGWSPVLFPGAIMIGRS